MFSPKNEIFRLFLAGWQNTTLAGYPVRKEILFSQDQLVTTSKPEQITLPLVLDLDGIGIAKQFAREEYRYRRAAHGEWNRLSYHGAILTIVH
jgi:hypothetical protein